MKIVVGLFNGEDEGNFEAVVSTTLLKELALEDNLVSNSLDLSPSTQYSMVVISEWCLIRDWWIRGYRKNKTGLRVEKRDTNKPIWGHRPEEYFRKTPNRAKKNETEGHS